MDIRYGERVSVSANVGCMSLIGVRRDRPVYWGNYFSNLDGVRFVNMWAENLTDAVDKGIIGDTIDVILYKKRYIGSQPDAEWALVVDDRLPSGYIYDGLCFTGDGLPPIYYIKEMYDLIGDPKNEFEQYLDPKAYYERNGGSYNAVTGIITTTFRSKSRTIE